MLPSTLAGLLHSSADWRRADKAENPASKLLEVRAPQASPEFKILLSQAEWLVLDFFLAVRLAHGDRLKGRGH